MNPKLAETLRAIQTKSDEVKGIWDEAGDELPTGEVKQRIMTLNHEIEELEHKASEMREVAELRAANEARQRWLTEPANRIPQPGGGDGRIPAKAVVDVARMTYGERFVNDPAFKAYIAQIAPGGYVNDKTRVTSPAVLFGGEFTKALVTGASDTSAGALVFNDIKPLVNLPVRPLTIRDIITQGTTNSDTVEYPQVTGFTNNAAPVAEATAVSGGSGSKPESDLALVKVTAPVKTIAHWIPATKRALSDAGQIRTIIDTFLRYGLEEELEDQIVSGSGSGENFTGILNFTGTTAQAWDTNILTTTRKARTLVRTTGRARATAYPLAPADWETIDLLQDNEARYFFGGPAVLGNPRLWGLPVVESEALTAGTGLVGDFRQCVLWDREAASIMVSDSHMDFFTRNMVAILAELRAAFGIFRPAAIVEMDLTA
jgi:HK97 family phage major capsid protein